MVYNIENDLVKIYQNENKTISSLDLKKIKLSCIISAIFLLNIINNRELRN